jgi:hypothetical protein
MGGEKMEKGAKTLIGEGKTKQKEGLFLLAVACFLEAGKKTKRKTRILREMFDLRKDVLQNSGDEIVLGSIETAIDSLINDLFLAKNQYERGGKRKVIYHKQLLGIYHMLCEQRELVRRKQVAEFLLKHYHCKFSTYSQIVLSELNKSPNPGKFQRCVDYINRGIEKNGCCVEYLMVQATIRTEQRQSITTIESKLAKELELVWFGEWFLNILNNRRINRKTLKWLLFVYDNLVYGKTNAVEQFGRQELEQKRLSSEEGALLMKAMQQKNQAILSTRENFKKVPSSKYGGILQ